MGELRGATYAVKIKVDGKDELKDVTVLTKDYDGTLKKLKASMGNVTAAEKTKESTEREAKRTVRALSAEYLKQQKALDTVVSEYENMNKRLTMTAKGQEIFNAQVRAGVDPLSKEGKQIANLVSKNYDLAKSQNATQKSMRGARGAAQNFGWQLQDTVVQAQMGTDAFVILSQQGSQMAASFGAMGAVIGAGIAIVGAAIPSLLTALGESTTSIEDLNTAADDLDKIFGEASDGTITLSEDLGKLYKESKKLGELQLFASEQKLKINLDEARVAAEKLATEVGTLSQMDLGLFNVRGTENDRIAALGEKFAIPLEQAKKLNQAFKEFRSTGDVKGFGESLSDITTKTDIVSKEFVELSQTVVDYSNNAIHLAEIQKKFNELIKQSPDDLDKANEAQKGYNDTFGEFLKRIAENQKAAEQQRKSLTKTTNTLEQEKNRRIKIAKDGFTTQSQYIKDLDLIEKWYTSEVEKRTDKQVAAINRVMKAEQSAMNKRAKQLDKMQKDLNKSNTTSDPVQAEMDTYATNMAAYKRMKSEAGKFAIAEQIRINGMMEQEEERHTQAMKDAQLQQAQNYVAMGQVMAQTMSGMVDLFSTGGSSILSRMEEMNGAQKTMFLITQAFAAANSILAGYQQASNWASSPLAKTSPMVAEAMGTASIAMGYANAGAVMGVTVAGAFDKGGVIPSGQAGVVSEFGDEIIGNGGGTLVYNNSGSPLPVTGREQTAKLMGGQGGQTVVQNITVSGNGDAALIRAMKTAAKQGADQAYARVQSDFKNDRGISKRAARR